MVRIGMGRHARARNYPGISRAQHCPKLHVPVSYILDMPLPARFSNCPDKNYASPSASGQQRTFHNKAQFLMIFGH